MSKRHCSVFLSMGVLVLVFLLSLGNCPGQANGPWRIHDLSRPQRPVVTPGVHGTQDQAGRPPSDAIVLFSGKDLSEWTSMQGGPAKWIVKDGVMESVKGSGYVMTARKFGDCQLHVEWAAPLPVIGNSQGRGNSGVFLMNTYEVQVLDSYQNKTYPDGQASAVYGQYPPQVNAALPPGQWQTYDIIFHRPRFDTAGKLLQAARITVLHNGVLTQDSVEIKGPTNWMSRVPYKAHEDKMPLALQDHGNPVRYRNIWIRELPEAGFLPGDEGGTLPVREVTVPDSILQKYAGEYKSDSGSTITVERKGSHLVVLRGKNSFPLEVAPVSETKFAGVAVETEISFQTGGDGKVTAAVLRSVESPQTFKRLP